MRIIVFLFIFQTFAFLVHAQEQNTLIHNWLDGEVHFSPQDTLKIESLIEEANSYLNTQSDRSILLSNEAIRLSERINYSDGIAKGLLTIAMCYVKRNDDSAQQILRKALPYCEKALFSKENLKAQWERVMALSYINNGETERALPHLLKAKTKAIALKDTTQMIKIYGDLGILWMINREFNKAQSYLEVARNLSDSFHHIHLSSIINNFASLYRLKNDTANLFITANQALRLSIQEKNTSNQRRAYGQLGGYYMEINQHEKALNSFQKALELADKSNSFYIFSAYWGMSESYYWLKKYDKAEEFSNLALAAIPIKNKKTIIMVSFYNFLAQLHYDKGDYQQAFLYKTTYSELSNNVNNIEKDKALNKLEIKSHLAEKDKELVQKQLLLTQQQSNLNNKKMWIVILVVSFFLLLLFFVNFVRNSRRKLFIFKQQGEINKLKAMMNGEEKERNRLTRELHDGIGGLLSAAAINFNTLGSDHPELINDPFYQKTEMIIGEISKEIRKTAHNLMPDALLKNKLPDAIRLFCSYLQKDKNLDIKVMTYGSFDRLKEDFRLSVFRIIQELVHNIVKHAYASKAFIQLHNDYQLISITVEDDGIGYDKNKQVAGMGLKNIQERVHLLKGRFSTKTGKDKGTSIYIEFDLSEI